MLLCTATKFLLSDSRFGGCLICDMTPRTDAELLRAYVRDAAESAFGELVTRYTNLVYSAALRQCACPELAREVTQDVFTDLARKARTLAENISDDATLGPWLYKSTRYAALNAARDERRRVARALTLMPELHGPPDEPPWNRVAPVLDDAMAELNDAEREAVVLRYFQNLDFHAVGRALNVSDDTAQKRVSRAIERLRELIAKRGVTVGGSGLVILLAANSVQAAPIGLGATMLAVAAKAGAAKAASSTSALVWLAVGQAKLALAVGVVVLLGVVAAVNLRDDGSRTGAGDRVRLPVGNGVAKISMGASHGFILASDGSLWSWGTNFVGWPVLGLGPVNFQPHLRRIGNDQDWVDISTSFTHALAIKSDGTIWGWGDNLSGQLGNGLSGRRNALKPVPAPTVPGNDWKQVTAGGSHSLALKKDGTLWAWGENWGGQTGLGLTNQRITTVTQVGTNTDWVKVWAAGLQSAGLRSDGSLWFWGHLVGDSKDTNFFRIPTRVSADTNWLEASFGYFSVHAIKTDGTLWAWGRDAGMYTGQPIQRLNPTPVRVGTASDWQAGPTSEYFYRLLQKRDGSIWALDASDYKYVAKTNHLPAQWRRIALKKKVVAFGAASRGITGVALTDEGEVWTWGNVIGENTPGWPTLQTVADKLGWKTDRFRSKPLIREEPWRLPHEE